MSSRDRDPLIARVELARQPGALMAAWRAVWEHQGLDGEPVDFTFRVVLTHYRPGVRARLFFEGTLPNKPRRRYFFAQLYPNLEAAEARLAVALVHKEPRRTKGPPVFVVSEWCGVVWELPGGPKLRTVRSFMQRKAFRRTCERLALKVDLEPKFELPRLLRYVPRKRAVFRWEAQGLGEVLFIKLYEPGEDTLALENLGWLAERSSSLSFETPRVRRHYARRRAVFMQGLEGEVLTSSFAQDAGEAAMRAVGQALADLHGLAPELERAWTRRDEFRAMEHAMEDMARALPGESACLRSVIERLGQRELGLGPGRAQPIHGNFFGDQVLFTQAGPHSAVNIGMVDWDDLALGDAEFDVARLMAHLRFENWRDDSIAQAKLEAALLEGYRTAGGALDGSVLVWYLAVCLLMRAKISGLRKLTPGWRDLCQRAIEEAERLASAGQMAT